MNSKFAVKTEDHAKTLSGTEIIKSCSMTVQQGTIYGFLDENGTAKTTVF